MRTAAQRLHGASLHIAVILAACGPSASAFLPPAAAAAWWSLALISGAHWAFCTVYLMAHRKRGSMPPAAAGPVGAWLASLRAGN